MSNNYNEFIKLGIDAPFKNSGVTKVSCPKCEERKGTRTRDKDLSINYTEGFYKCHSSKCTFQGKVGGKKYSRPEWRNNTTLHASVVKYFEGRGISQRTLKAFQISTDGRNNIEFNYFRKDQLINVKTRFDNGDGSKSFKQHSGAEKIVFNYNSIEGKEKCIIVEGEMDVLSWYEAGVSQEYAIISVDQGAPNPGDKTDGKLECFTNCAHELNGIKEFFICTDKDAPGLYLEQELVRRLGEYRCSIIPLPKDCKDANDLLQNKSYSLSVKCEALKRQLLQAKPVPVPGIHDLSDDVWLEMENNFINGRKKGSKTHFPELNGIFSFLPGDITIITGLPNDGKSQFMRQLAVVKSKMDGWKWACYVPEDFPVDMFYDDICHIYMGKSPYKGHENQMSLEEYRTARTFAREHFFCIYPEPDKETGIIELPTNEWINKRISFLKLKHGINAFIKDPWNKIHHTFDGREDQYLAAELSREKFFAASYDASIYIAHPGKMRKDDKGRYPSPDVYDISGGSMWNNMADNIMVVYRPERHIDPKDPSVDIMTKKIKKQKIVGKIGAVRFMYCYKRNRYYEELGDFNPLPNVDPPPPEPVAIVDEYPKPAIMTIPPRKISAKDQEIPF